jgi:hypothetical protein
MGEEKTTAKIDGEHSNDRSGQPARRKGGQTGEGEIVNAEQQVFPDDFVEAGSVDLDENPPRFEEAKHRARTASCFAYILVIALIATLVLHYITIAIIAYRGDQEIAEILSRVFDKWLPIISGFVGGAITYYFTKEAK